MESILLLLGGLAAGTLNSIAGGAAIFLYPLMLSLGLKPVSANATLSLVVWPGTISSAIGYRRAIKKIPSKFFFLLIPSFLGGEIGAVFLGHTSNNTFEYIVPWLLLLAAGLIGLHTKVHGLLNSKASQAFEGRHPLFLGSAAAITLFLLGIYGGYFGAGYGVMLLAFLSLTSFSDINQMNGFKNLSSISMNLMAITYFVSHHLVTWHVLPLLAIGDVIGGWLGANYGSRLPASYIRAIVVVAGVVVSLGLLIKTYA
ncbi:MAG TPA: sulfite exporter TauE/SafE family protein [Candidatus Saccharimonadales bacterium]|nr:sulfite exporter TauE/SafE family protein [Candidatus Saccharimonadales bacterium]